ncbi:MAG: dihydroneopterin aldolase family protein [Candidatus Caldarchaeum sp.]
MTELDPGRRFFPKQFSDRERAVFEAGIALGALFHSLVGLPVTTETKHSLETAFEKSFSLQPFRKSVKLRLSAKKRRHGPYGYGSIGPRDISASVVVSYGSATAVAQVRYVASLGYPLMYVSKIIERRSVSAPRPYARTRGAKSRRSV